MGRAGHLDMTVDSGALQVTSAASQRVGNGGPGDSGLVGAWEVSCRGLAHLCWQLFGALVAVVRGRVCWPKARPGLGLCRSKQSAPKWPDRSWPADQQSHGVDRQAGVGASKALRRMAVSYSSLPPVHRVNLAWSCRHPLQMPALRPHRCTAGSTCSETAVMLTCLVAVCKCSVAWTRVCDTVLRHLRNLFRAPPCPSLALVTRHGDQTTATRNR